MPTKIEINCLRCGKYRYANNRKFCSKECELAYNQEVYIAKWKAGKISGLWCGVVTPRIKRYLREKYEDKCCLCGWSKKNVTTGVVPLVADHIDGNYLHNTEENLRLICWNCDSIGPTFGGLNKGKGRKLRKH